MYRSIKPFQSTSKDPAQILANSSVRLFSLKRAFSSALENLRCNFLWFSLPASATIKITSSPLTIVQDTATAIDGTGCEITGGAGVIAMDVGDSAIFATQPIHGGVNKIVIGQSGVIIPEHGMFVYGKQRGDTRTVELQIHKAQSAARFLRYRPP